VQGRAFTRAASSTTTWALIYPQGLTPAAQMRLALALAAFNLVVYGLIVWRRWRARRLR
jgi:hypothetical protein